jgi:epoxyqueuosine reductase
MNLEDKPDFFQLAAKVRAWGQELGFQQIGITDTGLAEHEERLNQWLALGMHGDMDFMQRHGSRRSRPGELVPGTLRVISARMDYLPESQTDPQLLLQQADKAFISRYALGRDYHKLVRRRLQQLATRMEGEIGAFGYRVFTDSAPVMEKPLAQKAGLGWQGKHTNLITKQAGSWFFLGELYTDLPLPVDQPAVDHCGSCRACMDVCPTGAIIAAYQLDARLCISYLTIEHSGSIPIELRSLIGNRIYGCDDCQIFCPWNKFARYTNEQDFAPRHGLDAPDLLELFSWDESTFLEKTRGSAVRRIGHERWLRNIAVALGNSPSRQDVISGLQAREAHPSALVREHVAWALERQRNGPAPGPRPA